MSASGQINFDELSGAQKAAVLCLALGAEGSSKLLQHLSEEEVEQITLEIAALRKVDSGIADKVLREYKNVAQAAASLAEGGVEFASAILEKSLGPARAEGAVKKIQEQLVSNSLRRLKRAPPELLNGIFRGEHPQTIALILAHLDSDQASLVVQSMEPELAADVLMRMARMEKVSPEMLQIVEATLSSKTDLTLMDSMTEAGGPSAVAGLLNSADANLERALLDAIAASNPEMADQIKNLMFVFEDLKSLDNKTIQRVLRDVDTRDLALALKAVSLELKEHILSNMSERAASALQEEMEFMGPVRVRDVEEAQSKIINTVRRLEEAGEIMLADRGGDDFIT